ncbi:MAG: acetoacetate--CoA ligase [Devosiaceae bacterium]|nr:acetoacetate--CoA ligase [Devosiaceae bacterium]
MNEKILWEPSRERKENSSLWQFALATADQHHCAPEDYAGLLEWSIKQPDQYYYALWDFLDIIGHKGDVAFEPGKTIRDAKFFPGAKLNYAQNMLANPDDSLAMIAHLNDGERREITRVQLRDEVSRIVQALKQVGVKPGDRIAAIVTNDIEATQFYLASAAIGAIWASCSPDFGPAGATDRLAQISPKVLIAVPGYSYGNKQIAIDDTIKAVAATPSVEVVVILGKIDEGQGFGKPSKSLTSFLAPFAPEKIPFHLASFDAPLAILFSSGTTGKPKCIVHSAGGLLLQHKKEQSLGTNIKSGDRLFYFSTCGWMMWNWQLSALSLGATLVTYDGNPFYPEPTRLPDIVEQELVSVFGTSAKYIDACSKFEVKPVKTHNFEHLKTILSTGSTLLPRSFDYIYRDWKADVHLASVSGGTDICACFVGGVPTLPVHRGQLQGAMLGMELDALDENANPLENEPGEFVCRTPHPSMPIEFWGDKDGSLYHKAYFSRFENMWAQGDFVEKRPGGGFIIHGRSDTTLNPGGVRIGTAEIYRQVEKIPEILEAAAVAKDKDGDQQVVLFVRLAEGGKLSADLQNLVRKNIRTGATPRHVPAQIVAVPDIPRTRSGKISELAIRDAIHGRAIKNTTALANSECLEFYTTWGKGD